MGRLFIECFFLQVTISQYNLKSLNEKYFGFLRLTKQQFKIKLHGKIHIKTSWIIYLTSMYFEGFSNNENSKYSFLLWGGWVSVWQYPCLLFCYFTLFQVKLLVASKNENWFSTIILYGWISSWLDKKCNGSGSEADFLKIVMCQKQISHFFWIAVKSEKPERTLIYFSSLALYFL